MILTRLLGLHQNRDVNSATSIITIIVLGILNVAILFVAPVLIGAMVELLGFTEAQAGFVISAELVGMSLASLPALYWVTRVNWRRALLVALSFMILGNLLSTSVGSYIPLLVLRFLVGLAAGSSMAICLSIIGTTGNPDRVFGLWVTGQLVFGALGLFLLPSLLPLLGYGFIYLLIAVLIVGLLFMLRFLPQQRSPVSGRESVQNSHYERSPCLLRWAAAGLLSIFICYAGQYGVWAYLDRIGSTIGLAPDNIGKALSLATIVGIVGALGAAALHSRFGRFLPVALGSIVSIISMFFLLGDFDYAQYVAAACGFSFTFNFILPYLMACVVNVDMTGRLIVLSNIASGGGLGVGPAMAGILQHQSGYNAVIWTGIGFTVLSLILVARLATLKIILVDGDIHSAAFVFVTECF